MRELCSRLKMSFQYFAANLDLGRRFQIHPNIRTSKPNLKLSRISSVSHPAIPSTSNYMAYKDFGCSCPSLSLSAIRVSSVSDRIFIFRIRLLR